MKVILYIGHHKVGSTALQVFLSQNWLKLAQNGILYPSVETRGFSHNLAKALGAGDQAAELPVNIREPHSALAYRMIGEVTQRQVPTQFNKLPSVGQMFQALRQQVARLQPETVILCSEVFANFGQIDPALITRLCGAFPDADFQVYCALRRPDDYLISWHGQRLKVGEHLRPLSGGAMDNYFDTIHFNFRMVVEAWTQVMPDARLTIRNYADVLAAGGSTEDFAAQIDAELPDDLIPAGRANKSLPRAALEIVRCANNNLPPHEAHMLSQYLLNADDQLNPAPNAQVEMFGARARAEIADRFAPIHTYLSELTGQDAFFSDIAELARERPMPEAEASADLLAQIDLQALPNDIVRDFVKSLRDKQVTAPVPEKPTQEAPVQEEPAPTDPIQKAEQE